MENPKSREHPHYDITNKMREIYPDECKEWEKLLEEARDPQKKGCFTCQFYNPIDNSGDKGFVDYEELEGRELPWDTESAYIWCDKFPEQDASLRIGCSLWQEYEPKI
jgi:hypothetical protein